MSDNYTMRGLASTKPYEEFSPGTIQSFDKNRQGATTKGGVFSPKPGVARGSPGLSPSSAAQGPTIFNPQGLQKQQRQQKDVQSLRQQKNTDSRKTLDTNSQQGFAPNDQQLHKSVSRRNLGQPRDHKAEHSPDGSPAIGPDQFVAH